jgi:Fic/DOC family
MQETIVLRTSRSAEAGTSLQARTWRRKKSSTMCDYVNENWEGSSPVHLSAYVLWKLNWIHPFTDGNGRTARAISYLLLCLRLGYRLPGTNTIPKKNRFLDCGGSFAFVE